MGAVPLVPENVAGYAGQFHFLGALFDGHRRGGISQVGVSGPFHVGGMAGTDVCGVVHVGGPVWDFRDVWGGNLDDRDFWNGYIEEARHYEEWTERVAYDGRCDSEGKNCEETVTPFQVVLMSAEASADFESGTMASAVFGEEG